MNPPEEYINNSSTEPGQGGLTQDMNKLQLRSSGLAEGNNLEKVREILFGSQIRDVDKRFTRLEERLITEINNFRDEAKKRLDALETYIKKEVDALTERVKKEQVERESALKAITEEQKSINQSLERKFSHFDEQNNHSQRELREQILNQSKELQEDIQKKYEEILVLLKREMQALDRDKTDRTKLATLFTELAVRLNTDYKS
ncbi:hypothetical protein [Nostoc sp. CMAA1605]|uniref:hypothetical protein n=1 Tax=Nostoc sp. CMAA1605 TaxID=2055159 RepID=UPI001F355EA9|nr:hypothetical protein [Nostoc sp. CMAA1605]MCF4970004.1 hypothetical protein [Nostoc sp. CMAA1605]